MSNNKNSCAPCINNADKINKYVCDRQLTYLIPRQPIQEIFSGNRGVTYYTSPVGVPVSKNAVLNTQNQFRDSPYRPNGVSCDCSTGYTNSS